MPRTSDKRERLLDAAKTLIHHQGYRQTTLADIAEASGVPLGNVYYYFKTKEDLGAAVIEVHTREFTAKAQEWGANPDPRQRLRALLEMMCSRREGLSEHGCPVGSLVQELDKHPSPLTGRAARLLKLYLDWATEQFRGLGKHDAETLGEELIIGMQGAILLSGALQDPSVIERKAGQLKEWVTTV